jgi:hypothetical protein
MIVLEEYCKESIILFFCIAHVSPEVCKPDACRSMNLVVKRYAPLLKGEKRKRNDTTLRHCACRFKCHTSFLGKQKEYISLVKEFESL